ncbi:coiled-coil-helix-coiled-coil-helix domain-containing protein 7 [Melitaea cinxia]|uniref:coiled-coil-helix-coiled-coil-helix domain-containing protein 7 n=1 Tax=Melitaea cinxia TaxID=113334 RepID=UPI001E273CE6|nr:coiled-coil-helix-coiled-coil-helix domain-containing protein 7 [Melitaea cinxia]
MKDLKNTEAERLNPCLKEQQQSYECLNKNGYVQEKCETYFDNYNTCKKFWGKVFKDRRARGLTPYLPDVADRETVKAEYLGKMKDRAF